MLIERELGKKLKHLKQQFQAIALLGPRQSGKTTLARHIFPTHQYVNLEELDTRRFAQEDPRGFLDQYREEAFTGVIFDEIQNVPDLFSYLQVRIDQGKKEGFYVLTGSQNILLNQHISQTLAGRISLQTLLPLSIAELIQCEKLPTDLFSLLVRGFYPSLYAKQIDADDWYKSYIQTYVERDVRHIRNVTNLSLFQKFLKLCAGRIGQLLNLTSLSDDCGVSVNTARAWISILEASYVLFLLPPYHKNFSKRLIKSPKLYFYDVGIACHLLGIESPEMALQHYLRGGLFESMILSNFLKERFHKGKKANLFFWRDKGGLEVDCLLERGEHVTPIEIKSAQTVNTGFFDSLDRFCELAEVPAESSYIIYGGEESQLRKKGHIVGWKDLALIPNE